MVSIVDKREKRVEYGQLNCGQYFRLDNNYYIKTNIHEEGGTDYDWYALNIVDGTSYLIGIKVLVEPVDVQVEIR